MTESSRYETSISLNVELTRSRDAQQQDALCPSAKAPSMSRVFVAAALALAISGCSQSSPSLTAGLSDGAGDGSALGSQTRQARQGALGGEPDLAQRSQSRSAGQVESSNQRLASLDDRAPRGTYDKAPRGAMAGRDFSTTGLNAEQAREMINAYRKQNGLKPLKLNASLTEAAKNHSRDLAKWDRISHFGSDGSNPWDRVKRTGYNAKLAAENVGTGQVTIDEVMKGWKDSPGHNKNLLLKDADHMGIALVHEPKSEFKTFWTLVLGSSL